MKKSKRFIQAFNALYSGWLEGQLIKGSCACCAVGNIIAKANGIKIEGDEWEDDNQFLWHDVLLDKRDRIPVPPHHLKRGKELIHSTGYSVSEIDRIEQTFEYSTRIPVLDYARYPQEELIEDQYNGLIAVLDVLCELDNVPKETYHDMLFGLREEKLCSVS